MKLFLIYCKYELLRNFANATTVLNSISFFLLIMIISAISAGPSFFSDKTLLISCIWTAAVLSCVLTLDAIFYKDFSDGTADLLILSSTTLEIVALAKAFSFWVTNCFTIIATACLAFLLIGFDKQLVMNFLLCITLVTLTMSLIGVALSALTANSKGGGLLLTILVFPLMIPPIIFGTRASLNAYNNISYSNEVLFLLGFFVLLLSTLPWASAAAIKTRVH